MKIKRRKFSTMNAVQFNKLLSYDYPYARHTFEQMKKDMRLMLKAENDTALEVSYHFADRDIATLTGFFADRDYKAYTYTLDLCLLVHRIKLRKARELRNK